MTSRPVGTIQATGSFRMDGATMPTNGTLFEDSVKLNDEEEEAVWKMLADKQKEKRQ